MILVNISDDIPPQNNILNMVIPIIMHFCVRLLLKSFVLSHIVKYIAGYTIKNF